MRKQHPFNDAEKSQRIHMDHVGKNVARQNHATEILGGKNPLWALPDQHITRHKFHT